MQRRAFQTIGAAIAILTAGCAEQGTEDEGLNQEQGAATATTNGLKGINGLNSFNGLNAFNGLSSYNGLNAFNGLSSYNGLMSTSDGRSVVSYLVRCALPAGHQISKQDQSGNWYTFQGAIGVGAAWEYGACDEGCQQAVSACMMAHINTVGVHIPLWLTSPLAAIGWGNSPSFPTIEGAFFGNIFHPNAKGKLDAYFCNGKTFDRNVVPGRLGADQQGSPYSDPLVTATNTSGLCTGLNTKTDNNGNITAVPAAGTTFNAPITVWRGQVFQAETASPLGGSVLDCANCSGHKRVGFVNGSVQISLASASLAAGTHTVVVYYTNGDANPRSMKMTIGKVTQVVTFPSTGTWDTPGLLVLSSGGFVQGTTNQVLFSINNGASAPDLDWIEIQ